MDIFTDPANWLALGTLLLLEIVLGIDNVVFISILAGRLPETQRNRARIVGLSLALITRILLLLTITWIMRLTTVLFTLVGHGFSGRDLILIAGGLFLIAKGTHEMHTRLEGDEEHGERRGTASFAGIVTQILVIDIIFSLDSVITAVGMVDKLAIMITAVVLAVIFMLAFSGVVSRFIDRHPTVKMLALAFLLLIGVVLVADGVGQHISKGYIYFAMAFALFVEILNLRARAKRTARRERTMRISASSSAILACVAMGHSSPAVAQVDQQRAQEFFKEAKALCERDGGRLWGVSVCMPMVIGDARTQTFATSQPPPDAPRPRLIGILMGPIQWGDSTWAALAWDVVANQPPRVRNAMFLHESFHILQRRLGLLLPLPSADHLDLVDGRYWLRLEWHALARALREAGDARKVAVREALAFRQARHMRYPDKIESEHALEISEGLASYTGIVLAAQSQADAITSALDELAGQESGESYVRTAAYASGPAYGLLLDAASPGWTRTVRASDDLAALLMRALGVQPVADAAAASARYGGAELRAAEEQRAEQREARIAGLRRRFVDGPLLLMPGGGSGFTDSHGAVVIPDVGTVWFGEYHMRGPWGALDANNGVLLSTDGRTRRLPSPVRRDEKTISGDGWTLEVAPGWVVREGARQGDYEVVKRP